MRKVFCAISIIAVLLSGLSSCKSKNKPKAQNSQVTETSQVAETSDTGKPAESAESEVPEAVDAAHNSRNSLDWNGVYTGTVPCADCPGINVMITLNLDETYQISYQYIDRDKTPIVVSGKFKWDKSGGSVTLDCKDYPSRYMVGENMLFQLDMEGKMITGEHADKYVLTKKFE
ncbi:MAG: copper resistance protein NlpE [Prevotellaceae bacterium]|jgi:uncharacterized lipoprotein NlpE involved in copper resistance|nr:copper resistance protein NlpE [Prevotellaceae bacterium]